MYGAFIVERNGTDIDDALASLQPVRIQGTLSFLFETISRTSPPFNSFSLETSALKTCLGGAISPNPHPQKK
jgi:hypothetical protein